jgi:hypothetical protein
MICPYSIRLKYTYRTVLRKPVSINHVSVITLVTVVVKEFHNVTNRDSAVQHMDIIFVQ